MEEAPTGVSMPSSRSIRIGISSCLLGDSVRYDGGHKRDSYLTEVLGRYVEWVPVCPEVELGLGVPRPPIQLEHRRDEIRLIMPSTGTDLTAAMTAYAENRVRWLQEADLSGYVLKSQSPSCGLRGVEIHRARRRPSKTGRGLFAQVLRRRLPYLPVAEETSLQDSRLRESFLAHVLAYHRWREMERQGWTPARLLAFHERHKALLTARSQTGTRRLHRLLAGTAKGRPVEELACQYLKGFTAILRRPASRQRQTNALQSMHDAGEAARRLMSTQGTQRLRR